MAKNRFIPTAKIASVPSGVSFQMPSDGQEEELTTEPITEEGGNTPAEAADSQDQEETIETAPAPLAVVVEEKAEQKPPVVTPAPIAPVVSQVVVSKAIVEPPAVATTEKGKIDMNVQHQLEGYAEAMAVGKPINPSEGGQRQYGLYKLIKSILATEEQSEFTTKFNTLLGFVKNNQTSVFSENYVFRFPSQWGGSDNEFTNFRRIMTVIIATADTSTRAANLLGVNMEKAMEGFTEKEKNKLIVFYNL